MNDVGNLLQMIYDLLTGWLNSFTSYATDVMEKLNLIEEDTASIKNSASDIKSNTDAIKDNTGAIITPVQSIKTNTDSIKTDTTSIKNNVSTMTNQLGTISTNVGTASSFTEDVANNTLDIKDRIVTIGSDTTQLRSNSNTITSDVSDIKTALNYYLSSTPVTEDVEGAICNLDTDLTDYLQACKVTIPADQTGYTGITISKCGKNLLENNITTQTLNGTTVTLNPDRSITVSGTPTSQSRFVVLPGDFIVRIPCRFTCGNIPTGIRFFCLRNSGGNISYPTLTNGYNLSTIGDKFSSIRLEVNTTYDGTPVTFYPMISSIDNDTVYEPYKAMTYPVSFGSAITDGAEVDLLEGLIKINSTPVSYQSITPVAVRTYKGVNNIYSDVGTTALTYRETLKHYIDKQEA